jgi:hypothetical protein
MSGASVVGAILVLDRRQLTAQRMGDRGNAPPARRYPICRYELVGVVGA